MSGKRRFQKLFETLHAVAIAGMNIGGGSNTEDSGEKEALKYVRNHFKSSKEVFVFDVGANVGDYAVLLKKIFGKTVKIFSFEPSRKTFRKLQSNIGNDGQTSLYDFGLGDKNEKTVLFTDGDESALASVYQRNLKQFNIKMEQKEEIEMKTLDSFCAEKRIKRIHLLKLDVEGHEKKVLDGAAQMIQSGNIDFIQFEFGGCNIDSKTYFRDFYDALNEHYKIYRIVKDGLFPISRYKETYEVFTTTNFLAEKR